MFKIRQRGDIENLQKCKRERERKREGYGGR